MKNWFNGKINIVFGFFYFACTAVLGPLVLVKGKGANAGLLKSASDAVETYAQTGGDRAATSAFESIVVYLQGVNKLGFVGSAAHAHGNLEALLNIVAGLVVMKLDIDAKFKTVLCILFLIGALFHSGVLYLASVFGMYWASNFSMIGGFSIVIGLLLTGVAAIAGIKAEQK
ncbi:MAG: hypothetical protein OEV59_07040 [Deltaproteobacteria bacterium]|nr:hypothetical protein [Deltaproteobacteria bacterium]